MRKTPYKWAVRYAKMMSKIFEPRLETDALSCQKSQNALKTGGEPTKKKEKKAKNKKYILKKWQSTRRCQVATRLGPSPSLAVAYLGARASRRSAAILLNAKSH